MTTHVGGLRVRPSPPTGSAPLVVIVHGTGDRGATFERTRRAVATQVDRPVITYDRRGYAGSMGPEPSDDPARHVADLLALLGGRRAVLFGHSFGALVTLHTAIEAPNQIEAVAVYEPPLPWEPWWPPVADLGPVDQAAERFLRRMIGDEAWAGLGEGIKARRRAEGPALLADYRAAQTPVAWDDVLVPVAAACGGRSAAHFRRGAATVAERIHGASLHEIAGAGHGAHLTHPDELAVWIAAAVPVTRGA